MLEKVMSCMERIRLIRSVNYGIITNEQIQDVFVLFDLDDEQKKSIFAILEEDGIIPIPEMETPQKVHDLRYPPPTKVIHKELDEQSEQELRGKRFTRMLETYRRDVKDNPKLALRYEEEMPIFIKAITALDDKTYRTVNQKIVEACMVISDYRVREAKKHGWVCGTYMSRVIEDFEYWVQIVIVEEELAELIDCFVSEKELTQEQIDMVKVLLHNTPKTLVHRYYSSMLNDKDRQSHISKKGED